MNRHQQLKPMPMPLILAQLKTLQDQLQYKLPIFVIMVRNMPQLLQIGTSLAPIKECEEGATQSTNHVPTEYQVSYKTDSSFQYDSITHVGSSEFLRLRFDILNVQFRRFAQIKTIMVDVISASKIDVFFFN